MTKLIAILLALLFFGTSASVAQAIRPEVLDEAPAGSLVSAPGAQFAASNDGSSVALKIGMNHSSIPTPFGPQFATFDTWSFTAEAPLSKSDKSRTLFSQDGFGNATTIAATFSRFQTRWRAPVSEDNAQLKALCEVMRAAAASQEGPPKKELECSGANVAKYLPKSRKTARALMPGPAPGGWLWGGAAKFGRQDVTYYDALTLAKSEPARYPWSVGAFLGWNPDWDSPTLFLLKADRAKRFDDHDDMVRCPGGQMGTPVDCVSGAIGAPDQTLRTLLHLEVRRTFASGMGVALEATRDFTKNTSAVALPIYLFNDGANAYIGGVRIAWRSDDRKTGIAVFVGLPFSAFTVP